METKVNGNYIGKLRKSVFIMSIGIVLASNGILFGISGLGSSRSALLIGSMLGLVGSLLGIAAMFLMRPVFKRLGYDLCVTGTLLQIIGFVLVIAVSILIFAYIYGGAYGASIFYILNSYVTIAILAAAGLLLFAGVLFASAGFYEIGSVHGNRLVKAGAACYYLGVFGALLDLSLLSMTILGSILIYFGLESIENGIRKQSREIVGNEKIDIEEGYIYFVKEDGTVWREPRLNMHPNAKTERIGNIKIKIKKGYSYTVSGDGYIVMRQQKQPNQSKT